MAGPTETGLTAVKDVTALDRLHGEFQDINEQLANCASRAHSLADKLNGPLPEGSGESVNEVPNGLIGSLSKEADTARTLIGSLSGALQRLEGTV